jgi:uncharacterized protein (TIGR00369 family)
MSETSINTTPPFDELAQAIASRRSVYGAISGLALDRAAPGEAWSSLPYRPVFVGDSETGVLHGGVVTAMLDESCGLAVQLALDGTRAIATLDLRIDYQKPATPGLDIKAHSICTRVTRSIAFVRATAYQESEDDPVATATACFMIGANRTNMLKDRPVADSIPPTLDAPDDPSGLFAKSPFARRRRHPGDAVLAKDHRQPDPARHPRRYHRCIPRNDGGCRRDTRACRFGAAEADRIDDQLPALRPRARQLCQRLDRQAGPAYRRLRGQGVAG